MVRERVQPLHRSAGTSCQRSLQLGEADAEKGTREKGKRRKGSGERDATKRTTKRRRPRGGDEEEDASANAGGPRAHNAERERSQYIAQNRAGAVKTSLTVRIRVRC